MRTTALPARGALRLAAGSAWLSTRLLVPGRADNEFIGVRIKGGSLALSGASQSLEQAIVVSGQWNATLQFTLDVPAPTAAPAATGVGEDALAAQINLPAMFRIQYGSTGLQSVTLADSSFKAYGNTATLTRAASAPGNTSTSPCSRSSPRSRGCSRPWCRSGRFAAPATRAARRSTKRRRRRRPRRLL